IDSVYTTVLAPKWLLSSSALASMPLSALLEIRSSSSYREYVKFLRRYPGLAGSEAAQFGDVFDRYMEEAQYIYIQNSNAKMREVVLSSKKRLQGRVAISVGVGTI